MEIRPRYDGIPAIELAHTVEEIRTPFLRQRRRLVDTLATLTDDEWTRPSRCEGWTAKEVVSHLAGTDRFWSASVTGALAGTPTRFLVGFDPKATPAALAAGAADSAPADLLAELADSAEGLCVAIEALTAPDWERTGESPVGHVSLAAVVHHALWDAWIHERDILLPLGRRSVEEPDELAACLRYSLALSPAFGVQSEPTRTGTVQARVTHPTLSMVAEVDHDGAAGIDPADGFVIRVRAGSVDEPTVTITGDAATVVDALSIRAPLPTEVASEDRWLVDALGAVFETEQV